MNRFALALAAMLFPTLAVASEVVLCNTTGGQVEIRAVRRGVVKLADGETKTFFNQAEDGDFRVWLSGDKCDHVFLYETADDVRLQVLPGPVLYKLPADATQAMAADALKATQPKGWPMTPSEKRCD